MTVCGTFAFTQEDPISLGGGDNLYGFAGGDAVNGRDPFGLCDEGKPCPSQDILNAGKAWVNGAVSAIGDFGNSLMSTLASLGKEAAIQGGLALATDGGSLLEDVGFGSEKLLAKHFADHGAEFGASTASQYLGAARRFFGGEAETATRGADKLFYREASNEFGVLAADGKTIRTFFKPTEGRAYFDRIVSNLKP